MNKRAFGILIATAIAGTSLVSFATSAHANTFAFNFSDVADGVSATGTIDVVGGIAVAGTGTLTSPVTGSGQSLTLMTFTSPGGATDDGGGVFSYRWGGTDQIVDNVVPLNTNGILFGVGPTGSFAGTTTGFQFGFNLWENPDQSFTGFIAGSAGQFFIGNGTGSITPVSVPGPIAGAGLPGLIMALGGLLAWRKKRNGSAALAA